MERSVYGMSVGTKPKALAVTLLLHVAVVVLLMVRWTGSHPPVRPSAPLTVTTLPLSAPPEAEEEKPVNEAPKEVPPTPQQAEPVRQPAPLPLPIVPLPSPIDLPRAAPAPRPSETAAPKAPPAPPAPRPQSNAPDSWEGRVLARLERFRRYPAAARNARQQGVVYVRFRIDRKGRVLSAVLARSSGYPALDQAALDTLRRADPLPEIPADRPGELELSVPVEFYIR